MAEYYPLLAKAIASLAADSYEQRRAIYDRARKALNAQLRQMTPAVPEADIAREGKALEAAIDRLEVEERAKPKAPRPPAPVLPAATPPAPMQPARAPPEMSPPTVAAVTPPVTAPSPYNPRSAPQTIRPPAPQPALLAGAETPLRVPQPRLRPAAPDLGEPVDLPAFRPASRNRTEPPRPAAPVTETATRSAGNGRWWILGIVIGLVIVGIAGVAVSLKQKSDDFARSVRPASAPVAATPEPGGKIAERIGGGASAPSPVTPVVVPTIPVRPAPQPTAQIAPQPVAPQPVAPQPAAPQAAAPQAAPQPAAPAAATDAPAAPDAATVPVAYRAAVLIDAPDDPQKVKVYRGTVVWKLDRLTPSGKPPAVAVRAEVDVPDVKLRATIVLQKNTDATLPASHTMEIRFLPASDSEVGGVKAIKVPEMRREETPSGDPLSGAPAPVIENFFFVGLSRNSDADLARNLDLLTSRGWIDVPMLLNNDKIAKLTVEKGVSGDQVLAQALEAWK